MTTDDAWRDGPEDREDDDRGDHGDRRDGAATFRPVRGWAVLWRSAFGLRHGGHEFVVAVDFDWDERIRLYRDGRLVDEQRSRARFDLGGATLEARMAPTGCGTCASWTRSAPCTTSPLPGTAEAWRDRMDRERPTASRAVGVTAWVVLAVALVTQVPQLLALASEITGGRRPSSRTSRAR